MVVPALGSSGSEVDESVARRQGWYISWKRKTWSTMCPGRLEGDTFQEKGPSIKEEGGRVFPHTTGWGRQWVKEKQWQDHSVCHRAPKEKALSQGSLWPGPWQQALAGKWGHLSRHCLKSHQNGTTQGEPRVTPPSPSILGHTPRPSLYPLGKKVLRTNLKGLHPFCYQRGPGARGPDLTCHLFFLHGLWVVFAFLNDLKIKTRLFRDVKIISSRSLSNTIQFYWNTAMPRVDQLWLRLYGLKQLLFGPTQSKYWSLLESTEKQPTLNWLVYRKVPGLGSFTHEWSRCK